MLFNDIGDATPDNWTAVSFEAESQVPGDVIVTGEFWHTHRAALIERYDSGLGKVGLRLSGEESLENFRTDLSYFGLIEFKFEKFTDGRPFSQAALLRSRFAYQGELRASGDIHVDQLAQLRRVGFTSFSFNNGVVPKANRLPTAAFREVYQGAADTLITVREQRRARQ